MERRPRVNHAQRVDGTATVRILDSCETEILDASRLLGDGIMHFRFAI